MRVISSSKAREEFFQLLRDAAEHHEPIRITGRGANAVLISEEDWTSIQETLHLLGIPGMRESIREGLAAPVDECADKLDW